MISIKFDWKIFALAAVGFYFLQKTKETAQAVADTPGNIVSGLLEAPGKAADYYLNALKSGLAYIGTGGEIILGQNPLGSAGKIISTVNKSANDVLSATVKPAVVATGTTAIQTAAAINQIINPVMGLAAPTGAPIIAAAQAVSSATGTPISIPDRGATAVINPSSYNYSIVLPAKATATKAAISTPAAPVAKSTASTISKQTTSGWQNVQPASNFGLVFK